MRFVGVFLLWLPRSELVRAADAQKIQPESVRHPFCTKMGCVTSEQVSRSVVFCGDCQRYPSDEDLRAFTSLGSAERLAVFQSSSGLEFSKNQVSIKQSAVSSGLAYTMSDRCRWDFEGGRTSMNHVWVIPINRRPGISMVEIGEGPALRAPETVEPGNFQVRWRPGGLQRQGQKGSEASEQEVGVFRKVKNATPMIDVLGNKSFVLVKSNYGLARKVVEDRQDKLSGASKYSPLDLVVPPNRPDQASAALFSYSVKGVGKLLAFNPLTDSRVVLFCDGIQQHSAARYALSHFKEYRDIEDMVRRAIAEWTRKQAAAHHQTRSLDNMPVREAVINKRNHMIGLATTLASQKIRARKLEPECLGGIDKFLTAFSDAVQSLK